MRKFLLSILVVIFSLILVACGGSDSATEGSDEGSSGESSSGSGDKLVVVDWGGAITDARVDSIFKPFEEEYGVEIVVETPTDYGKFKAMVESGNVTWDVVNVATLWAEQAVKDALLEEIDYSIVDKDGIVPEVALDTSVGAEFYSTVIAYNTDVYSDEEAPQTWQDFWDVEKYPGPRGFYNSPSETLEIALLADGVAPEDLYPLDIDRALASLEKLEEKTEVIWWDAGAQPVELLTSGTLSLTTAWSGRITTAQSEGAPVGLTYSEAILSSESWVVPRGSKNKDLAMEFINFATRPEQQAAFSQNIDYSPTNEKALDLIPEDVQEKLGASPELTAMQVKLDPTYWAGVYDEVNQRFQEWHLR